MKITLMNRLLINSILIIVISLSVTSIISTHMINDRFDLYLLEEHKEKIKNIQSIINSAIEKNPTNPDFDGEGLRKYAFLENYFIKIVDLNNKVIYSTGKSHLIHNHMMTRMMGPMMGRRFKESLESYMEDTYTLEINGKVFGRLVVGYFGPSNISKEAVIFKTTLYKSITISFILAVIIGIIISMLVSRQLGIPIKNITVASKEITSGNLSVRTDTDSTIKEISELSFSINYLASTLQKQEDLRKRLTSDMAHEIKTPLTTIKSHIEAFLDGIWKPTEDKLKDCYDEINRLTKLVQDLEDINKLEQNNYILNKTCFNMGKELERIINSLIPQFSKRNLDLNHINNTDLKVFMDKHKFKQIMYNLLINAFKYSYEGGTVNIYSYVVNRNLYIRVQDFGMGISKKDLPHIFDHLYRGDPSRTRATGGSGIGLTIAKTLVEAHGGCIYAESNSEKGTVFTLEFPLDRISI